MDNPFYNLKKFLTAELKQAFKQNYKKGSKLIQVRATDKEDFGDYQCDSAMKLATPLRKKPVDIAMHLIQHLSVGNMFSKVDVAHPGFINFTLNNDWIATQLTKIQDDERLGTPPIGQDHTIILDYSCPNVAKPMHIGHIRSTVIGNALDRIHRFLGYNVISDNHLGDWGTQFGLLILGYKHFADQAAIQSSPIEELERIYRLSYEKSKQETAWLEQARREVVKLQSGDAECLQLWQFFVDCSMREFNHIYQRLGIKFDLTRGESFYNNRLPDLIKLLSEKGVVEESDGALVARLDDVGLPLAIIRKSDGGYNYASTDLATILSRFEEFKPETIIYVTDERQQLHFAQIFAIARKLGITTNLEHVWFGLMRLPTGTFSTRQGNVIKLELLLDEAEKMALQTVQEASPDMPLPQQLEVARAVGIGAIKYTDLSQNPQSLVTFSWEKALALDGNSAPYLQYAYARIASVLDKFKEANPTINLADHPIQIKDPIERRIAIHLLRFGAAVEDAATYYRPNFLSDYLYNLAQLYSTFYQNLPFLKAEPGVRESRLRLCAITAKTLRIGLSLLGIETPDRI